MFEKVSRSLKYDSNFFFVHKHIYGSTLYVSLALASYTGPYTREVRASFQGGVRARYPLSDACARFSQKSVK